MNKPIAVTDSSFAEAVLNSDKPVLVDFWAEWCGPCRILGPVVDEVAGELSGQLTVVKVNIDDSPEIAAEYNIHSIPTLALFVDGEEVERLVGAVPKATILKSVGPHVSPVIESTR